ncbi:MAG TPA: hypothetical protein VMU28_11990 [Terriglobales bacterium]|nr:hypothetical protein [Terriglobales bacterium]
MLIPTMETLVFLKWGDNSEGERVAIFQNIDAYRAGIQFETAKQSQEWEGFLCQPTNQLNAIFDYEHALENLMSCSLRRRKKLKAKR